MHNLTIPIHDQTIPCETIPEHREYLSLECIPCVRSLLGCWHSQLSTMYSTMRLYLYTFRQYPMRLCMIRPYLYMFIPYPMRLHMTRPYLYMISPYPMRLYLFRPYQVPSGWSDAKHTESLSLHTF